MIARVISLLAEVVNLKNMVYILCLGFEKIKDNYFQNNFKVMAL